jgi:hypothetical protein
MNKIDKYVKTYRLTNVDALSETWKKKANKKWPYSSLFSAPISYIDTSQVKPVGRREGEICS